MKSCPKCGAENLQTANSCRMCAVPLEAPESLLGVMAETHDADPLPPTVSTSGTLDEPPASPYATHAACPACQTINDPEWLFCMQCGNKLEKPSPPQVEIAPAAAQKDQVTCGSCGATHTGAGIYCTECGGLLSPPPPAEVAPEPAPAPAASRVVLELITDGGEVGEVYPMEADEVVLGRVEGDVTFSHDGYLSSRHARVVEREGRYFLVDEDSRNGTFIRIDGEVELKPGDTFLIGKQLLRFNKKPA